MVETAVIEVWKGRIVVVGPLKLGKEGARDEETDRPGAILWSSILTEIRISGRAFVECTNTFYHWKGTPKSGRSDLVSTALRQRLTCNSTHRADVLRHP